MTKKLFLACALAGAMLLGLMVLVAVADSPIVDLDREEEDFRVIGEDALDYLGEMTTGDINADGVSDLIVGASGYDVTGTTQITNAGAVYVIFGSSNLSDTLDLNNAGEAADIIIHGTVINGYAGHTVASGDVNGDGYADVIVGADLVTHTGRAMVGAVYVIHGPITQVLTSPILLSDTAWVDLTIYGDDAGDRFGRAVTAGDVNSDTVDDLIVGSYLADGSHGSDSGKAYVFYGGASLTGTLDMGTDSADVTVIGYNGYDRLGRSVTTGDVNGDGTGDLIIGAYWSGASTSAAGAGEVVLIYGSDSLSQTIDLNSDNLTGAGLGLRFYGIDTDDGTGFFVGTGNINGDENPSTGVGYDDILVGAFLANHNEDGEGYAIYGGPNITAGATIVSGGVYISECVDITLYPADAGDRLGRSVASADLNADGYDDFIIGASRADPITATTVITNAGETYVFYGGENLLSTITISPTGNTDLTVLGDDENDESGRSSAVGDLNGDGVADLIIGAVMADSGLGEVYVIWGPKALTLTVTPSADVITAGQQVTFTVTARNTYSQTWDVSTYTTTFDVAPAAGGSWGQNVYTTEVAGPWVVTATHRKLVATTTITVNHANPVSVTVEPSIATITAGQDISYTVTATDTYGNDWNATATAAYTTTLGASGDWNDNVYTSAISGTWTVTATLDGIDDTAILTVDHADASSVSLDPATETVTAGEAVTYTTTATDTHGNSWDATAAYTITPGAGGDWNDSIYTSAISGTWTVTATVDGVNDTATLTVNYADVASVALDPVTETIEAGEAVTYTAVAIDAYGNSWDATAAYTITPGAGGGWVDNVYTSAVADVWVVTGTVDGVDGMSTLTVNHADAVSVSLDPATETIEAGEAVTYTAVATDSYGNSWNAAAVYTITPGAGGGWVDNVYTSAMSGTWTVTGTVNGANDTATLTVNHADAASVLLDPATEVVEAGETVTYTVTVMDTHGNSWDAASEVSFDIEAGAAGSWTANVYTSEAAGTWTVTGTVDGVDGIATLTVNHADAASVLLDPATEVVEAGEAVTYIVTATDTHGNSWDAASEVSFDIEAGAAGSWTANVYTSEAAGTWTVTATVDGVNDTATLTVNHADAASVTLDPATETIEAGEAVTYTAVATDAYGNSWDATAAYTITPGAGGGWADNVYTSAVADVWAVTGTVDGVDGIATLMVNHTDAVSVTLDPAAAVRTAGQSVAYTAIATDTYGNSWDAMAAYTITPGAGGGWNDNVYTSAISGTWTVTATLDGVNGIAALTVNAGMPSYTVISPDTATITAGDVQTYTAEAFDAYDNSLGDVTASTTFSIVEGGDGGSWASNVYTSNTAGNWTVRGSYSGNTDDATLTVNLGGLDYVIIRTASDGGGEVAGNHVMTTDEMWTLWVAGYDAGDNYIGDVSVDWSVTGDSIGTVVPSTDSISTTLYATTAGTGRVSADHATATDDETGDIAVSAGAPGDTYIYLPLVVRGG